MAQKTAVEWLVQQLKTIYDIDIERLSVTDKAKQMEEEQIKKAYRVGKVEANNFSIGSITGEEYYNETYGKTDSNTRND